MKRRPIKVGLVCTMDGHFEQMLNLSDVYSQRDHFWITNSNKQTTNQLLEERKYFIRAAHFKQPWTYCAQIPTVVKAFLREKPTHLLSTGSGRTALIPFLLANCLAYAIGWSDRFVLNYFLGPAAVGVYVAAYSIARQPVELFVGALNSFTFPLLVRAYATDGSRKAGPIQSGLLVTIATRP